MESKSIEICDTSAIEEAEAKEFKIQDIQILVLRWHGELRAYINSCPHAGWPLNFQPNTFFNLEKTLIQCSNHMAMFEPGSGKCISGPCTGDKLAPVPLFVENEKVFVTLDQNLASTDSAADYI